MIDLKKSRAKLLDQFCVLIGEDPKNGENLAFTPLNQIKFTGTIPKSISSEVIVDRPDYLKAEKMIKKAGIDVRVAKKEFLPSINLTGLALLDVKNSMFSKETTLAALALGAMLPVFTGGSRIANLKLKKVQYDKMLENYYKTNLNAIQEALGITVTDDNGNPVEFTNDTEGVKSYVNSVIDLKSKDIQTATINKLFADNPLIKEFIDYVQLTGSPQGFGELPDRSGIEIDKNNINQQEAIIRMAAQEFGNKSLNENYIKYLKDSGGLYDEAKQQLTALVEKDVAMRKDIEEQAEANRQAEQVRVNEYWQNVSKVIEGRIIAGYKLSESFTKEVNGQKVVYTPNDFYNYLNKAIEQDADGNIVTGYQRDLSKLTDEEYLNRELLDAWLMFTGGTYKDLIDMAVKEDNVRKLKIKSKEQRTAKSIKVIKKQGGKVNMNDIIL